MVRKKQSGRKITLQKSSVRKLTDEGAEKVKGGLATVDASQGCVEDATNTCGGNSVCLCLASPPSPGCFRRTA